MCDLTNFSYVVFIAVSRCLLRRHDPAVGGTRVITFGCQSECCRASKKLKTAIRKPHYTISTFINFTETKKHFEIQTRPAPERKQVKSKK
jgi:hypothetical protein